MNKCFQNYNKTS